MRMECRENGRSLARDCLVADGLIDLEVLEEADIGGIGEDGDEESHQGKSKDLG